MYKADQALAAAKEKGKTVSRSMTSHFATGRSRPCFSEVESGA